MFRIFQRMGAHEQALIIDASQVFSPISIMVLWMAKLWKHPISTWWLTKEDFTRSFGAQTLWGTTIRCRGGAKRVENPGASPGSFLSATRCLLKLMLGLHWVQRSQEIYWQYLQPSLRSELMFRFQVLIKRHDGIGCFLHPSTRSTCLTIFFLAVRQVFHVFQWEAMFLPMLPMVSKFKWHLPRFFARTGTHYHASRLQHSGRNQMVRSFPGHDPEHKEQLSHNRWFLTSSWCCRKAVPGRFTCCMHVETI